MTIDEALDEIGYDEHCFVAWDNSTGEILSVTTFAQKPTPAEMMRSLQQLQGRPPPVKGRFFEASQVDRLILVNEAAETASFKTRGRFLDEWSRLSVGELLTLLSVGELLTLLEANNYKAPMGRRDSHIIVDHLWQVHREELTGGPGERLRALFGLGRPRERLRVLLGTGRLHEDAERKLRAYLFALDGDEAHLKAMWTGQVLGRQSWSDAFVLMDCFAHVQTQDQEIIGSLVELMTQGVLFGPRFEVMMTLGKLGPAVGLPAAKVIRAVVYDSEPWIIATRDRVLARLEGKAIGSVAATAGMGASMALTRLENDLALFASGSAICPLTVNALRKRSHDPPTS